MSSCEEVPTFTLRQVITGQENYSCLGELLLGGPEVAIIASQGLASVSVFAFPRTAIVSTGDELVTPGEDCRDWQIWRSNSLRNWVTIEVSSRFFSL